MSLFAAFATSGHQFSQASDVGLLVAMWWRAKWVQRPTTGAHRLRRFLRGERGEEMCMYIIIYIYIYIHTYIYIYIYRERYTRHTYLFVEWKSGRGVAGQGCLEKKPERSVGGRLPEAGENWRMPRVGAARRMQVANCLAPSRGSEWIAGRSTRHLSDSERARSEAGRTRGRPRQNWRGGQNLFTARAERAALPRRSGSPGHRTSKQDR